MQSVRLVILMHIYFQGAVHGSGRPRKPPKIWQWLANLEDPLEKALEEANTNATRKDVNDGSNKLGDTEDSAYYDQEEFLPVLETISEVGFNLTGVFISPESILNPVKWVVLLYNKLPPQVGNSLNGSHMNHQQKQCSGI